MSIASQKCLHFSGFSEITEVSYNPDVVSYSELLTWFFTHTDPTAHHKKQYQSAIIYVDEEQKKLADSAVEEQQVAPYFGS